jgi:hypothetical protein
MAYPLVRPGIFSVTHQLLHSLQTTHFLVDLLQHLRALFKAKQNIFLHKREFNAQGQLFQLL